MDEKNFGAASVTAKTVAHELSVPGSVADRKTAHTPGPWLVRWDADSVPGADTFMICADTESSEGYHPSIIECCAPVLPDDAENHANAARIAACVNACEGMADPTQLRVEHDALVREESRLLKVVADQQKTIEFSERVILDAKPEREALKIDNDALRINLSVAQAEIDALRAQRDELAAALLAIQTAIMTSQVRYKGQTSIERILELTEAALAKAGAA